MGPRVRKSAARLPNGPGGAERPLGFGFVGKLAGSDMAIDRIGKSIGTLQLEAMTQTVSHFHLQGVIHRVADGGGKKRLDQGIVSHGIEGQRPTVGSKIKIGERDIVRAALPRRRSKALVLRVRRNAPLR